MLSEIIDFTLINANEIKDYEVEYWHDGPRIYPTVTFTMKNGDIKEFSDY